MAAGFHLRRPVRVLQHRAAHRDEIELAAIEARGDLVEFADAYQFYIQGSFSF